MMNERKQLGRSANQPLENPVPLEEGIDLAFLAKKDGAGHAWHALDLRKDRFPQDWRGGINNSYNLESVGNLLKRLSEKTTPLRRVSPESLYAIAQAFQVIGAPYTDKALSSMKEWVLSERERKKASNVSDKREAGNLETQNRVHVPAIHGPTRRRLNPRQALLLATAFTAGTWAVVNQTDWLIPRQESGSQTSTTGDGHVLDPGEAVASESELSGSALLEGLAPLLDAIQPKPTPIPLVESLPSAENSPYVFWGGIDLSDPSQAITVEWDSLEIREVRNGESLRISFFPEPKATGSRFPTTCLTSLGIDCSMALNGRVIVGIHSSWNGEDMLAMEAFRTFLEGGTKAEPNALLPAEERQRREHLLESVRPTITQGTLRVSAQASIVRIEEVDRDAVYEDWNTAQDVAQLYEPDLRASINLDKPYVDAVTCGWRLPGDRQSPKNHDRVSSSIYNLFLGEAVPLS